MGFAELVSALAAAYLHRLDPFLIQFPPGWPLGGLRWYGVSYAAGFVVAWLLLRWLARSGRTLLTPEAAGDLITYFVVGVVAGGRLGYVIFYEPSLLWDPPLIGVFQVWKGGMASHGGMIGVVLAGWLYARKHGIPWLHVVDISAFVATPGLCFGRLANFINGELLGHPVADQAAPPAWSVKFPQEIVLPEFTRHAELRAGLEPLVGSGEGFYERIIAAVQDGNADVIAAIEPLLTARYPSQLFQALAEGPVLLGVLVLAWARPRRPGLIAGVFGVTYALLRVVTELFRMPDPGVERWLGLSRGQSLSVIMFGLGVLLMTIGIRSREPRLGGWRARAAKETTRDPD